MEDTQVLIAISAGVLVLYFIIRRLTNPYGLNRKDLKLINAVIKDDFKEVQKYLGKGANPDAIDKKGMPALIIAASHGQENIANILIRYNANVNAIIPMKRNEIGGGTALIAAAGHGHVGIVRKLISNGADVNQSDKRGVTPLMTASFTGSQKIINKLIESGAYVDSQDDSGYTPLMYAANSGRADLVQQLIDNGADPNLTDKEGNTAYDFAVKSNDTETIKALKRAMFRDMQQPDDDLN